ncbi:hypothetical protein ACQKQD_31785 [Methylobacterium sp. NPDC080182]|uniref:hypothetical protein n=1 Tax=Methylobacterium sp. NPDC080182 TaxID=3390590 RepID=UPI003D085530
MSIETDNEERNKNGRERIISLVFGLLGVVQGLAFTQLAEKIPETFRTTQFSMQILSKIVYFAIGFFIVVRVFQTYSCGIVSYAQRKMKIWDLYCIFIAGLLQYWVFSAFDKGGNVDELSLFNRVAALSILAVILHVIVLASNKTPSADRKTQKVNIAFATGIGLSALMATWIGNEIANIFLGIAICTMLFANTWYSLNDTDFGFMPSKPVGDTTPRSGIPQRTDQGMSS